MLRVSSRFYPLASGIGQITHLKTRCFVRALRAKLRSCDQSVDPGGERRAKARICRWISETEGPMTKNHERFPGSERHKLTLTAKPSQTQSVFRQVQVTHFAHEARKRRAKALLCRSQHRSGLSAP
jgi:hypothetical protein